MTTRDERNATMFDAEEAIMGTKRMRIGWLAGLAAVVAIAVHSPLAAQETGLRAGWQPYLGCWQALDAEEDEGILCLVADGQDVEMLTIVDTEVQYREPLVADGGTHEFERDDCQGTESARFSDDRRRLYTASLVNCDGEAPRRSTGIIAMPTLGEWVDVRAIEVNGAFTVWSKRYQRTSHSVLNQLGLAGAAARPDPFALRGGIASAASMVTIDDVIDASRNVDADAVKGWLAEVGSQFEGLSAEDLIRMEEAGVATAVIDVVVAVSFPEHFALTPEESRYPVMYSGWSPYYGYGYGGFRRGFGFGLYPYSYYGGYPGYPGGITVTRLPPGGGGGQAVAGRGYRSPTTSAPIHSGGGGSGGWTTTSVGSGGSSTIRSSGGGRTAVRRGGK